MAYMQIWGGRIEARLDTQWTSGPKPLLQLILNKNFFNSPLEFFENSIGIGYGHSLHPRQMTRL
jgi:hypothetical protein